jgi:quercetin dioxygenase-like cupin family protein
MNNQEYAAAVDKEQYPTDPTVPLASNFVDERGVIQNILFSPINSVAIIESKAGSVRSNHYHKTDSHYLYVLSGKLEYSERNINGTAVIVRTYGAGEMFFTGPQKVHKVVFLEDTVLLSLAKNVRDHEHHEQDVVRKEF